MDKFHSFSYQAHNFIISTCKIARQSYPIPFPRDQTIRFAQIRENHSDGLGQERATRQRARSESSKNLSRGRRRRGYSLYTARSQGFVSLLPQYPSSPSNSVFLFHPRPTLGWTSRRDTASTPCISVVAIDGGGFTLCIRVTVDSMGEGGGVDKVG